MNRQRGFSIIEIIIGIVVIGLIGLVAWMFFTESAHNDRLVAKSDGSTESTEDARGLLWMQTQDGWRAQDTVPDCPSQPMLKSPADVSQATSILYPGQTRGADYKPHGGMRFDNSKDNAVVITVPLSGYVVRGSSYVDMGETQYMFDVINNCGVMYRLDHLHDISSTLQKITATWPAPTGSSMTHPVQPAVYVKQGEVLATKVGFVGTKNAGFDFGVYDLRTTNQASASAAYRAAHPHGETAWHAVCWLKGWLPTNDQTRVLALPPGDPTSGKNSDYCK